MLLLPKWAQWLKQQTNQPLQLRLLLKIHMKILFWTFWKQSGFTSNSVMNIWNSNRLSSGKILLWNEISVMNF